MERSHFPRIALSAAIVLASASPATASAQAGPDVTFELRPHCVESDHAAADTEFGGEVPEIDGIMTLTQESSLPCPEFAVRDPLSRQTGELKLGDTLDMDLVLHNPSGKPLTGFRAWIAYDSNVLEGVSLDLTDAFNLPTPGETDFSVADNYVKVAASSDDPVTDTKIVLARIVVKAKAAPAVGTTLSFYDASGKADAHTAAFAGTENAAALTQGSLAVRFAAAAGSSAAPASSVPTSSAAPVAPASSVPALPDPTVSSSSSSVSVAQASSSAAPVAPAAFSKLQVQSLRVTTEGSSVFLAWNPLPSTDLAGYNLYYGTISGKYLQRRAVDKESQTITIRALPVGQTYYFAVRAVNGAGEESDFSQEVAVTVGNPATSTSPLSGALIEGGPNGNAPDTDGNVAGESGPGTWILALAAASAIAGTMLAFRRQWTAVSADHR